MADPVDAYLTRLRAELRGLPEAQVSDIVGEIGSHVRDSAGVADDSVAAVLRRLGSPAELAAMYRLNGAGPPPPGGVQSIKRTVAGVVGAGCVLAGYLMAGSLAVAALRKPFAPDLVGLWRLAPDSFSLRLGFGSGPASGTELLGWGIVPVGLAIGLGLGLLTTRFARWGIGRLRGSA